MAAHLAGALAHPVWVALPNVPLWYWGREDRCGWYPTAVLFRAPAHGDWRSVIAAIVEKMTVL